MAFFRLAAGPSLMQISSKIMRLASSSVEAAQYTLWLVGVKGFHLKLHH